MAIAGHLIRGSTLCSGALGAALLLCALSAHAVPEPQGYWMGPAHGPVATTLHGATVIHAHRLARLLQAGGVLIVDVSDAPRRPANLATGAVWLPVPHAAIPGSIWVPGAGLGAIDPGIDRLLRERLAQSTGNDYAHPLVIYCHRNCWLSWNAAKRAISYGYSHVYWFPDGMEGWRAAGFPTASAEPLLP